MRIAVVSIWIVLEFWLARWQLMRYSYFMALAQGQRYSKDTIPVKRGEIYSADGVVLASDIPVWDVVVSLSTKRDEAAFFADENFTKLKHTFKEVLGKEVDFLKQLNHSSLSYYVIAKNIKKEDKEKLEQAKLLGIYFIEKKLRFYPNGTLASHVIGFVGKNQLGEERGVYGVEGYFWGDLKGKRGITYAERDIGGGLLVSDFYINAKYREGKNIVLTLRVGIQKKVEEILKKEVLRFKAKSGTAIIMDPRTGEIYAMANYPDYNPNYYWKYKTNVYLNKAVASVYEYGSVQKPLTLAMALDSGVITKDFRCLDNGVLKVLDKRIYNWAYRRYGWLSLEGILEHSDNVCAAQIGLKLGASRMYEYFRKLGIGSLLYVGLQEEETGILKSKEKWNKVDVAVASFGQMVTATPMQVLSAISTLANKGKRMQPFLVKKIYDSEETITFEPYVVSEVFKEDVANYIAKLMYKATMKQNVWRKYRGKYKIAGKTGTAQIPKKDGAGYEEDKVNTTFVGFVPYDNPRIIMIVRIEEPEKYKLASKVAVPVWQKIFDAVKDDLGIPQD